VLTIKTTGYEDYLDNSANIKMLVIGGPGVGKTRSASFWPAPLFIDIEAGRASLADRKAMYVTPRTSGDMLSLVAELRRMEQTPKGSREVQTIVVDTVDAYQRRLKDEWLLKERKQTFTGYEAWGWLETQMQQFLTRLWNLDYNVILNVHYKDKVKGSGDDETHELMLQLQGDVKDTIFNDLDLVGWMGTYWEPVNGVRTQKRGLSFKTSPDKPFLKDRFGLFDEWLPINFTADDYQQIFDRFLSRVEDLPEAGTVRDIPDAVPEDRIPNPAVLGPIGGALPPLDPKDVPLTQYDKPTLAKMARDLEITTTTDGAPIKGNTLKSEFVAAITAHRAKYGDKPAPAAEPAAPQQPEETVADNATPPAAPAAQTPESTPQPEPSAAPDPAPAPAPAAESGADPAPQASAAREPNAATDSGLHPGEQVDSDTGEISHDQAITTLEQGIGAQVESDIDAADTTASRPEPLVPVETPAPPAPPAEAPRLGKPETCEEDGCDQKLAGEHPQYVQLSRIKFDKYLCNKHYLEYRRAAAA
jgi:hypothetical protein